MFRKIVGKLKYFDQFSKIDVCYQRKAIYWCHEMVCLLSGWPSWLTTLLTLSLHASMSGSASLIRLRNYLIRWFVLKVYKSVSRSTGDQLVIFFCSSRISKCPNTLFRFSPQLCFIIGFICDLFIARNDSWMSKKTATQIEKNIIYMFLPLWKMRARVGIP